MPRTARIAPKEYIYHVLTRGNNRQAVFCTENDFTKYLDILNSSKEKHKFFLYHYVLMTNHIHMVMEVSAMGSNLSDIMKSINLTYARYYQKKYSHSGHLWQDRFKSIVISKDEYLLACGCYVELNPVRAGMVADPALYPWSSYHFNALGKDDPLLDPHPIVSGWSSDKAKKLFQYREFVKTMMVDKNALQGEMDGRQIYGSGDFIATLSQQYHIDIGKKPIGRPRKERNYSKIEPSVFARGHLNKK